MKKRCNNPKSVCYKHYGGRGIRVCARWDSFENFLTDMGERPAGMSLDRINNDGDYELGNCRWATPKQQARNSRRNRVITINGDAKPLSEWLEQLGMAATTFYRRVKDDGMSDEDALLTHWPEILHPV